MTQQRILAVCIDFGDTLADQATEIKDESETTLTADLIPGAAELLHEIKRRGYPLALVADGRPGTYHNVLHQHGLYHLFDALAISELVGVEKPDSRMFHTALDALGIPAEEAGAVVMVGNRLDRDVLGANRMGMVSVWIDWAPRQRKEPLDDAERPDYTIREPLELLPVIDELERKG